MNSKEQVVACAKLAEQANRYDDMADLMLQATELSNQMDFEERNLFSMAFKHSIEVGRRRSEDVLGAAVRPKDRRGAPGICKKVLDALENVLIPNAGDSAAKVFYIKMKADYYRYLAEVISGMSVKESSMILQLIRDNLTLWMDNDEMEQGGGDAAQDDEVAPDEGVGDVTKKPNKGSNSLWLLLLLF
uniref:14-3-3 domain-containing protein n=1 Tax=Ditylenchus dipsaci TaxID=166011 RepID=A0A915ELX6_9BILA